MKNLNCDVPHYYAVSQGCKFAQVVHHFQAYISLTLSAYSKIIRMIYIFNKVCRFSPCQLACLPALTEGGRP